MSLNLGTLLQMRLYLGSTKMSPGLHKRERFRN
jgi:hypothetical protein